MRPIASRGDSVATVGGCCEGVSASRIEAGADDAAGIGSGVPVDDGAAGFIESAKLLII